MLEDFKLKVFATVCRTHSFTKAARELEITQPAVSQNVAELEKLLGVSLFVRGRGEITLTPDGEEFARYADRILYWCARTEAKFMAGGHQDSKQTATLSLDGGKTAEVFVMDGEIRIALSGGD